MDGCIAANNCRRRFRQLGSNLNIRGNSNPSNPWPELHEGSGGPPISITADGHHQKVFVCRYSVIGWASSLKQVAQESRLCGYPSIPVAILGAGVIPGGIPRGIPEAGAGAIPNTSPKRTPRFRRVRCVILSHQANMIPGVHPMAPLQVAWASCPCAWIRCHGLRSSRCHGLRSSRRPCRLALHQLLQLRPPPPAPRTWPVAPP